MKCKKCKAENKDDARVCRKCGENFEEDQLWKPSLKWHFKTLGVIYAVLIIVYFVLSFALKPYLRQIPQEITPWLEKVPQSESKE